MRLMWIILYLINTIFFLIPRYAPHSPSLVVNHRFCHFSPDRKLKSTVFYSRIGAGLFFFFLLPYQSAKESGGGRGDLGIDRSQNYGATLDSRPLFGLFSFSYFSKMPRLSPTGVVSILNRPNEDPPHQLPYTGTAMGFLLPSSSFSLPPSGYDTPPAPHSPIRF